MLQGYSNPTGVTPEPRWEFCLVLSSACSHNPLHVSRPISKLNYNSGVIVCILWAPWGQRLGLIHCTESKEASYKSLNGPPSVSSTHPPVIQSYPLFKCGLRTLSKVGNSPFKLGAFILQFLTPLAFFPSFQPSPPPSLGSSAFLGQPLSFLSKPVLTPPCRWKLRLAPQKEQCPMGHSWRSLRTSGCTISCSVSLSSPRVPNLSLGR